MSRQFTNGKETIDEKTYRKKSPKEQFEYTEVGKEKSEVQKQAPKTSTNVAKASSTGTADMSGNKPYNEGKDTSLEDNPELKKATEKRDEAQVNNDKETVDKIESSPAFEHPRLNVDNPENAEINEKIDALQNKEINESLGKNENGDSSDKISDEAFQNPKEATQEDAANAQKSMEENGFTTTNEKGQTVLDKDKLMRLLAQPAQPSLLSKIFNTISALVSVATLGIVPRVDFNKVTGTTEYLQNVNKMIDDYNTNILSNYTAQVANAQGSNEANEIKAQDTNAEQAGKNRYAETGKQAENEALWTKDKEFLSMQQEYGKDMARLQGDIQKEIITLQNQNNKDILALTQDLQNKSAAEQSRYLYQFANDMHNDPDARAIAKQMAVWTAAGQAITPNMLGAKTATAVEEAVTKPVTDVASAAGDVASAF